MRIYEQAYEEGDLVYLKEHTSKKGESPKLRPMWKGPYLVIESRPPLYKIKTPKRELIMHHDNVKLCKDRYIPIWLRRARNKFLDQTPETTTDFDDFDNVINLRPLFEQDGEPPSSNPQDLDATLPYEQPERTDHGLENSKTGISTRGRKIKTPHHLKDYFI